MKKALSALLVFAMVIACFAFTTSAAYSGSTASITERWWKKSDKTIPVRTAEELVYVFEYMAAGENFSNKTIKLENDITINEGDAKDWASKAPKFNWYTIAEGAESVFMGTFDGQGHTISGLYSNSFSAADDNKIIPFGAGADAAKAAANGLFPALAGTVKNLRVTNSYVCGAYGLGVIAGRVDSGSNVVLENIQVDNSSVYATYYQNGDPSKEDLNDPDGKLSGPYEKHSSVGGFIGLGEGKSVIVKNCLFMGTVEGGGRFVGGLLGNLNKAHVEIINSGFNGTVQSKYAESYKNGVNLYKENSGGLLARTDDPNEKGSIFTNCFFIGKFNANDKSTTSGSIVGRCTTFTATDCFVSENIAFRFYDPSKSTNTKGGDAGMENLSDKKMTGKDAVSEMGLDESVWVAVEGVGPVLSAHKEAVAPNTTAPKTTAPKATTPKPTKDNGSNDSANNSVANTTKPAPTTGKKPAANTGDITVYMIAAVVISAAAAVVVSKSRH